MKGRFISIDVETANSDSASICQIGIAVFENGMIVDQWGSLVNPECHFSGRNVMIHGISEYHVANAPKIHEAYEAVNHFLDGSQVISYGAFDKNAISKAFDDSIFSFWLDATQVVRRVWSEFAHKGYALNNVCSHLQIELNDHHDALCDAIAAGQVFIAAGRHTSTTVDDWFSERAFSRYRLPPPIIQKRAPFKRPPVAKAEINNDGHLKGHVVVFTGELSMPREVAMAQAAAAGCTIGSSVTKKTTIVVVGQQDPTVIKGPISNKEAKAHDLKAKGQNIIIINEQDFLTLLVHPPADRVCPNQP